MAALRVAVRDTVTMAVELQAVSLANRQSLRNTVQVNHLKIWWLVMNNVARLQCCKQ